MIGALIGAGIVFVAVVWGALEFGRWQRGRTPSAQRARQFDRFVEDHAAGGDE